MRATEIQRKTETERHTETHTEIVIYKFHGNHKPKIYNIYIHIKEKGIQT